MKKIIFTFFGFFFLTQRLMAQGYDQGAVNLVIQEIIMGSGPITKVEYDKFWQQLGMVKREDKERVIVPIRRNFLMTQEYQKEIWSCAKQAWVLRSTPKCEKAKSKFEIIKSEMQKVGQEAVLKTIEDNSDRLLNAAAKREALKNPNGAAPMPLTLETISATEESLDKMLSRFDQVLRVEF